MAVFKDHSGKSYPLGATVTADGVNFAIYSKRADHLELLLFESADSPQPFATYKLTPEKNRTSNYWHIFLEGCKRDQVYAYRAYGDFEPENGLLFDSEKVLLDPYSRGVVGWNHYDRNRAAEPGDNCEASLRSVVIKSDDYDWQDERKPIVPFSKTVIYEAHVAGFTKNTNSGVSEEKRGTYAGLIEKIPYLKDLGITTLELMPVQTFDKFDAPPGLNNYWGYSPLAFFGTHLDYSSKKSPLAAMNEFRDMVKALHANGIEVILDVVFNHTTEGGADGPILSYKGLDNLTYYTLDERNFAYKNFSGCGNALRTEHPVVGTLILDVLRFWTEEMHVDGFRFDLASVLSRDIFGHPLDRPPLLWAIESDPILASCKLIAEAWDPAGLYQVGWFVTRGSRFAEWNGPFRDDVRKFVKGDNGTSTNLAFRLTGSGDIYGNLYRDVSRSINFVTCHDGFTLNDLVTYNQKHNESNLEGNRDGQNENFSWNCGLEGETDDPEIEQMRIRQIKNLLTILFIAQGTPMICAGDEVRRTMGGNNNGYCHDNETNWFDWSLVTKNREILEFTRQLISLSKKLSVFRQGLVADETREIISPDSMQSVLIEFHGVQLNEPDFASDSHSLAVEMIDPLTGNQVYAAFNAFWQPLEFELPALANAKEGNSWNKMIDTSALSRTDSGNGEAPDVVSDATIVVPARSSVCLVSSGVFSEQERPNRQPARRRQNITWTFNKIVPNK